MVKMTVNDVPIKVGTRLTEFSFSDKYPYEVIEIKDRNSILVRELSHKKIENSQEFSNEWELFSDPSNPVRELKLKNNSWYWVIEKLNGIFQYSKASVVFGFAEYYFDYQF